MIQSKEQGSPKRKQCGTHDGVDLNGNRAGSAAYLHTPHQRMRKYCAIDPRRSTLPSFNGALLGHIQVNCLWAFTLLKERINKSTSVLLTANPIIKPFKMRPVGEVLRPTQQCKLRGWGRWQLLQLNAVFFTLSPH